MKQMDWNAKKQTIFILIENYTLYFEFFLLRILVNDAEVLINPFIRISKILFNFLLKLTLTIVENLAIHRYPSFVYTSSLHENELKLDINLSICWFSVFLNTDEIRK